jgi:UDP-N-acetylglucosamine--N-acetylmuramyl-(pentapeptide) pyrophosphoryl-undecaprenol N-acetylglucosamine transferase
MAGKPAVFIPSPNVAEDHQTKNAQALVDKSAALLVRDDRAREDLGDRVLQLLKDPGERERLAENMKEAGVGNAAEKIVDEAVAIMKGDRGR